MQYLITFFNYGKATIDLNTAALLHPFKNICKHFLYLTIVPLFEPFINTSFLIEIELKIQNSE